MKRALVFIAVVIALGGCSKQEPQAAAPPATPPPAKPADTGDEFMRKAGAAGKAEVALAQDALARSKNPDVKSFAQKLVDDHTKTNNELAQLASSKGVTIPGEPDESAKKMKEQLDTFRGANFDQGFVMQTIKDHQEAVAMFDSASKNVTDPDVKNFAARTLPSLQQHLAMAQDLETKVTRKR